MVCAIASAWVIPSYTEARSRTERGRSASDVTTCSTLAIGYSFRGSGHGGLTFTATTVPTQPEHDNSANEKTPEWRADADDHDSGCHHKESDDRHDAIVWV